MPICSILYNLILENDMHNSNYIPRSKYFPSVKLKKMSDRPEHIQKDAEAALTDMVSQIKDWVGRAKDEQLRDLCTLFACGKPNKRKTRMQFILENAIKKMKEW